MAKYTILCVDDERNVLLTLRSQLIRHFPDYKIEIAESGIEALEVLQKELAKGKEIPLVIADQIMPMMKGDELLIAIHALYPAIIKVMLTGQARADEVGNVVNCANLYRFLPKPWNEIDLQLTITEAVRRYQQDQLITQQQRALEENLQQSQYFIKKITESVPNLLYIFDIAQQSNIYANYATKNLFGYSDDEIRQLGLKLFTDNCHISDRHKFEEGLQRCSNLKNGDFVETEYRVRNTQGQWRWLLCHNTVFLRAADGSVKQILSSCQDISDRKLAEKNLIKQLLYSRILEDAISSIRDSLSLQEIIDITVSEVRDFLKVDRVVIFKNELNGEGIIIAESIDDALTPLLGKQLSDSGFKACIHEYHQGKIQATADIYLAELSDCYLKFLIEFQIRANLVVPIIYNHQLIGLLSAQTSAAPRVWKDDEISLIKKLADAVAIAMHQAQLYQQIQQKEQQLRSVANVSPAVIFTIIKDPDSPLRFDYISSAFVKVHELSINEAIQDFTVIFQQIHPYDLKNFQKAIELSATTLQPFFHSWRIITSVGKTKWLEANAQPVDQANGGIIWHGVTVDVSDRKEAEELLEAQNRWLSCLALDDPLKPTLELLLDLIELELAGGICSVLLIDNRNRLIPYASPSLPISFFKVSDGILIGEGVGSCGTAAFRRELVITSDITTDPIWKDFKNLALAHDLNACWSMPIFSRNQEKVIGVFGIYYSEVRSPTDKEISIIRTAAISAGIAIERHLNAATIQSQLQQEQFLYRHLQNELSDREQAEAMLSENEELFRRAFEDTAAGMALISLEGQLLQVNQSLCELLGYSESELLEITFQELTFAEDLIPQLKLVEELIAGTRKTFQLEKRCIHRQGNILWVILSMSIVRDKQENPLYFVGQIQDITDRRQLEIIKDEFISVVSHELRTPLTAIRGALGILTTGIYDQRPEKSKRMLEIALNNSDRLSRLVNDILDLERLESGQSNLSMSTCQVSNLLEQAIESVQEIANQADIKIELFPIFVEIWACGDAIVQTLTNLLSNAIKFSNVSSEITLNVKLVADDICFAITDQGQGIPPEYLETIFGRFQQVDISDARQKGGSGLGLAICKSIIHQHSGKIWVESTLGKGSTFSFSLPLSISP